MLGRAPRQQSSPVFEPGKQGTSVKNISIELISEATNASVVRLPQRRFPGIVIQGDSLAVLVATTERVTSALRCKDVEEALDELRELTEMLGAYQREYENALVAEGLELPYSTPPR